uniref:Uncharacterized protein n=1 Tax=Romanomermis culicivorax TaxID=13658 RepID=A0A915JAI4_ROMCU
AFRCWRQALLLRQEYDLPFERFALTRAAHVAYQGQREAADLTQLDALMNDADKIRMQSLITRERILGPAHPDTTYYIRYRGAVYADFGVFSRCIDLWLYALNIQQSIMEPLCSLTLGSFMSFAELFCFLLNDSTRNQQQNFSFNNNNDNQNQAPNLEPRSLRFSDVYLILNMAVDEIGRWLNMEICKDFSMEGVASKGPFSFPNRTSILNAIDNCRHVERDKNGDHKLLLVIIHLLALAQRCLTHEQAVGVKFGKENVEAQKNEEKFKLRKTVYELLRVDPRDGQRSSLLHLACKEDSTALGNYPLCRFPSLPVIELLLDSGADWYTLDQEGRSPLHLCLANRIHRRSVAVCLLNKGASLFVADKTGRSPYDMLKSSGSDLPIVKYVTLKELAAVAVRKHQLPYRNRLPPHLFELLERL